MEQDSKRLEAMTFEEIAVKLAEQEYPNPDDERRIYNEQQAFIRALDLLRPLLDGWKDAEKEKPQETELYFLVTDGIGIATARVRMDGKWEDASGHLLLFVTSYRPRTTLPGDFSQLEALLTHKK